MVGPWLPVKTWNFGSPESLPLLPKPLERTCKIYFIIYTLLAFFYLNNNLKNINIFTIICLQQQINILAFICLFYVIV